MLSCFLRWVFALMLRRICRASSRSRPSLRIQVPAKGGAEDTKQPAADGADAKSTAPAAAVETKESKSRSGAAGADSEPTSPLPADARSPMSSTSGPGSPSPASSTPAAGAGAGAGGASSSVVPGLGDDADAAGRENVRMMIAGCNFTLYEFAPASSSTAGGAGAPGASGSGHGRKGSVFNPLEPSRPKVSKREICVFYAVDDTLFGSVYWCDAGQRAQSQQRRLRFHLLSDIYVGKQTPIFSTAEAQGAYEERCFSLISTEGASSCLRDSREI